jgi:hypothetical protein
MYSNHCLARVAQLDRASASEAEGCGFDPRLAHQAAPPTRGRPCPGNRAKGQKRESDFVFDGMAGKDEKKIKHET